jgi:toxin ParE1/3/4
MPRVDRPRLVEEDLLTIADWIARDNPVAARRWLDEVEAKFILLAQQPSMGEAVNHLHDGWRRISHGTYVIFFEPLDDGIVVQRVLHGARKIENLL